MNSAVIGMAACVVTPVSQMPSDEQPIGPSHLAMWLMGNYTTKWDAGHVRYGPKVPAVATTRFISSMEIALTGVPNMPFRSVRERLAATMRNSPRSSSTNSTLSPALRASACRTFAGMVNRPLDLTVAAAINGLLGIRACQQNSSKKVFNTPESDDCVQSWTGNSENLRLLMTDGRSAGTSRTGPQAEAQPWDLHRIPRRSIR